MLLGRNNNFGRLSPGCHLLTTSASAHVTLLNSVRPQRKGPQSAAYCPVRPASTPSLSMPGKKNKTSHHIKICPRWPEKVEQNLNPHNPTKRCAADSLSSSNRGVPLGIVNLEQRLINSTQAGFCLEGTEQNETKGSVHLQHNHNRVWKVEAKVISVDLQESQTENWKRHQTKKVSST